MKQLWNAFHDFYVFFFFKSGLLSLFSQFFPGTSHCLDLSAVISNPNRIFIAIDPDHFGRSKIISPVRWSSSQLLACELILQLGPNTNTLCGSATLDASETASWKLHRHGYLRIARQTSRTPPGALSFEEQREGLVACSRRTWSKHAPLEVPLPSPSSLLSPPRICLGHWDLYRSYPAPSPRRPRALIHLPGQQERPRYSRGKKGCNPGESKPGGEEGRDGFSRLISVPLAGPRIGTTTCLRRINIGPVPHRADYGDPDFRTRGPLFSRVPHAVARRKSQEGGSSSCRLSLPTAEDGLNTLKVTCGNRVRGKKSREVRPRFGSTSTRTMVPMFTLLLSTS